MGAPHLVGSKTSSEFVMRSQRPLLTCDSSLLQFNTGFRNKSHVGHGIS